MSLIYEQITLTPANIREVVPGRIHTEFKASLLKLFQNTCRSLYPRLDQMNRIPFMCAIELAIQILKLCGDLPGG